MPRLYTHLSRAPCRRATAPLFLLRRLLHSSVAVLVVIRAWVCLGRRARCVVEVKVERVRCCCASGSDFDAMAESLMEGHTLADMCGMPSRVSDPMP